MKSRFAIYLDHPTQKVKIFVSSMLTVSVQCTLYICYINLTFIRRPTLVIVNQWISYVLGLSVIKILYSNIKMVSKLDLQEEF